MNELEDFVSKVFVVYEFTNGHFYYRVPFHYFDPAAAV
jgi:hypothetical protein